MQSTGGMVLSVETFQKGGMAMRAVDMEHLHSTMNQGEYSWL